MPRAGGSQTVPPLVHKANPDQCPWPAKSVHAPTSRIPDQLLSAAACLSGTVLFASVGKRWSKSLHSCRGSLWPECPVTSSEWRSRFVFLLSRLSFPGSVWDSATAWHSAATKACLYPKQTVAFAWWDCLLNIYKIAIECSSTNCMRFLNWH